MDKTGIAIIGITLLVFLGIILAGGQSETSNNNLLGTEIPIQGSDHIATSEEHPPYNSNPPTSGWHYAQPASWGASDTQLTDEALVHNLEHGGIWISYHPDKVSAETIDQLKDFVARYRSKVVLAPRPQNDHPIALTSWGRLLTLETFEEVQITDFIKQNKNHGPERIPD